MGKPSHLYDIILAGAATSVTLAVLFGFAMMSAGAAYTSNSNVAATVNVPATCAITLSPTSIDFGSISPQGNVPTANAIQDANGGDILATTLIEGTDWTSGSNNFGVSNTLYDSATQGTYTGTALSNTLTMTTIDVGAFTSNDFYFGLGVPGNVLAGTYSQTITIENTC